MLLMKVFLFLVLTNSTPNIVSSACEDLTWSKCSAEQGVSVCSVPLASCPSTVETRTFILNGRAMQVNAICSCVLDQSGY